MLLLCVVGCDTSQRVDRHEQMRRDSQQLWDRAMESATPAGNVRVNIKMVEVDWRDEQAFAAAIRYRSGNVQIDVGQTMPGARIFGVLDGLSAELTGNISRQTTRTVNEQFLVMMPSTSGSIQVFSARARPWVIILPRFGTGVITGGPTQVSGTGMVIHVGAVTEQYVQLAIDPFIRRADDGRTVRLREFRTTVNAPIGEPFVIMADRSQTDSVAQSLLSYEAVQGERSVIAIVTAEVGR